MAGNSTIEISRKNLFHEGEEPKLDRDQKRQLIVAAATLITLSVNLLANILPINGVTTAEVSDQFSTYFVPADFIFLIWPVIYILLIAFTIFQALPSQKENPKLRKIAWWYVAGSLANIAWLFCWHYQQFTLSLLMILVLLICLIVVYEILEIGVVSVDRGMHFFVHLTFSVYLAWITIASIANITDVLDYNGWEGFGLDPRVWAVVVLVIAVVVVELITYNRQDLAFLAVVVWSFIGIAQNSKGISPIYEAAYVAVVVVLMMAVISIILKLRRRKRIKD